MIRWNEGISHYWLAGADGADACNWGVSGVDMIVMSLQNMHLILLIYCT